MIHRFDRFELDTEAYELRCEGEVRPIEPQVFDLLRYFVENPNRLISRDEIFQAIWSGRIVSDTALSSRVKAARRAIDDNGREQRLIRTVHGRGFRFVSPGESMADVAATEPEPAHDAGLLGREREQAILRDQLRAAMGAHGRMVFISGDSGIGKTSLVRSFLQWARGQGYLRMPIGHCVEQSGAAEPYLPMLDAIGQLCGSAPAVLNLLRRYAPSWLLALPFLLDDAAMAALGNRVVGAGRDRMLREMLDTLPALTNEAPLVLALEDMHWADASTIELLKSLARRGLPARLLVIATYRNVASNGGGPAVDAAVRELAARGQCALIEVSALGPADAEQFLRRRLGQEGPPDGLAERLLASSNGNPFFMGALADWWISRGLIFEMPGPSVHVGTRDAAAERIPPELLRLLGAEFERLGPEDQVLLEWAAVAGSPFQGATLASAAAAPADDFEERLYRLAQRQAFIRPAAGGDAEAEEDRFIFTHALKRDAIYWGIPASRRRRMHLALGRSREAELGARAGGRSVELARHFRLGGQAGDAVRWLLAAAQQAAERGGAVEALASLQQAKTALPEVSDATARLRWETAVEAAIASNLLETAGVGAPEAEAAFLRAAALARRSGDAKLLSTLLYHLGHIYELRGEFDRTQALIDERRALENWGEAAAVVETSELMACSAFHQGRLRIAVDEADAGLSRYDPGRHLHLLAASGRNAAVSCQAWAARALCFMGLPDTALGRIERALAVAEREAPYTLCNAHEQAAYLRQHRRERAETLHHAAQVVHLGTERNLPYRVATGKILLSWASCTGPGDANLLNAMEAAIAECDGLGVRLEIPYLRGLIAEVCLLVGEPGRALAHLAQALDSPAGGRGYYYEAELHRLRGLALSIPASTMDLSEATVAFERAFAVAEAQSARLLMLRTALSMAESAGDGDTVETRIAPLYRSFTEGHGTPDLKAASAILAAHGVKPGR